MVQLEWSDLTDADLPQVQHLASACLDADGGMPTLDSKDSIKRLFRNGPGRVGRDVTGEVVAAGALFLENGRYPTATGLVHPALRGEGLAEDITQWVRRERHGESLRLLIENDTPISEAFAAQIGMIRVFGEHVMRHSLRRVPFVPLPDGLRLEPWTPDTAPLFHRAWAASFAARPHFQEMSEEEWRHWVESEETFRPEDSRVALDEDGEPVGFVTVSNDWIDQVGVVPAWRGRGLGAHLVVRSLTALEHAGSHRVWLTVGEDNPAAQALYENLGFKVKGTRARYADPTSPRSSPIDQ